MAAPVAAASTGTAAAAAGRRQRRLLCCRSGAAACLHACIWESVRHPKPWAAAGRQGLASKAPHLLGRARQGAGAIGAIPSLGATLRIAIGFRACILRAPQLWGAARGSLGLQPIFAGTALCDLANGRARWGCGQPPPSWHSVRAALRPPAHPGSLLYFPVRVGLLRSPRSHPQLALSTRLPKTTRPAGSPRHRNPKYASGSNPGACP